jgi:ferric-dicitrate binding protein FerR (iron transport regulator)
MEKELLYRFFEGTASLEEEQHIRQWVEASAENERSFLSERKFFDATSLLVCPVEEGTEMNQAAPRRYSLVRELLKITAVALLVLACSFGYQYMRKPAGVAAVQTVSVPAGQRVSLILPDGSKVWLNARSTLTYPAFFTMEERSMELEGEAYFEVMANAERPFVVRTSKGKVEALGTKFNVEDYSESAVFEATLMSGSLRIVSVKDSSDIVTLTPDKKAILREGKLFVEQVDDYAPYRWTEGLICFTNASFSAMVRDFEKYYGVKIQVNNPNVLKYSYTGKFRQTDGVDYVLRVLQKDIRFKYSRDDENQIIYIE